MKLHFVKGKGSRVSEKWSVGKKKNATDNRGNQKSTEVEDFLDLIT